MSHYGYPFSCKAFFGNATEQGLILKNGIPAIIPLALGLCLTKTCLASPTFLAEYPAEGDDFLRGAIETATGYWLFGSVPLSGQDDSRIIVTDPAGMVLIDSLPPCRSYIACPSQDGCIVSLFIKDGMLATRKDEQPGQMVWQQEYPQFTAYQPVLMVSAPGGSFLAVLGDGSNSLAVKLDQDGGVVWDTVLPNSTPTGIARGDQGEVLVAMLIEGGSRVSVLNAEGLPSGGFECPEMILRDVDPFHGGIAVAAVGDGAILFDASGAPTWQYDPGSGCEVFALSLAGSDLAVTGSMMDGVQRRAFLALLSAGGTACWERMYGHGDSFRSISLASCTDGGFCSLGGYQDGASLSSFALRTDSTGLIQQMGSGDGESDSGPAGLRVSLNPFHSSVVITCTGAVSPDLLTVHDISGRLVRNLSDHGGSSYEWNGQDEDGNQVLPGLYLILGKGEDREFSVRVVKL